MVKDGFTLKQTLLPRAFLQPDYLNRINRQILTQPMRRTVRQVSRLNHRTFNPAAHADHSSASGYSLNCERPSGGMGKRWTPSAFNATLFPLTSGSLPRPLAAERPRGFFFGWVFLGAVTSTSSFSRILSWVTPVVRAPCMDVRLSSAGVGEFACLHFAEQSTNHHAVGPR